MSHLIQKKDTGLDLTISRAFAEAHIRFLDTEDRQHMVTFDIESAHRLGQMFDDRSMENATKKRSPITPQSKLWSFMEATVNTAISYALGLLIGYFVYGYYQLPIDFALNMKITATFLVIGMARHYFIRRWFNWMGTKHGER